MRPSETGSTGLPRATAFDLRTPAESSRHRRAKRESATAPQWVAVELKAKPGVAGELVVVLPRGYRIEVQRGFDTTTLQQLVSALERR